MNGYRWRLVLSVLINVGAAPLWAADTRPADGPAPSAPSADAASAPRGEQPAPYSGLHCRVISQSGLPVPWARIVVHAMSPAGWVPIRTFETGRSNECDVTLDGRAPGAIMLQVSAEGYQDRESLYVPNPDQVVPWVTLTLAGARVLEGRVVTEDGQPVRGAGVVMASPVGSDEMVTDLDGRFRFENLTPGRAMLRVSAPGLGSGTYAVDLTRQPEPVEIIVRARRPVTLRVLDEEDKVVAGLLVRIEAPEPAEAVTNSQGEVAVPGVAANTPRIILAIQDKFLYTEDPVMILPIGPGADPLTPLVRVRRGGRIVGRVVQAVAGAADEQYAVPSAAVWIVQPGGAGPTVAADIDGNFAFDAVPAGGHLVMTAHPMYASSIGRGEVQPGQETTLDLTMTPGATIRGTVVDGDGKPVARAAVRVLGWWPAKPLGETAGRDPQPLFLPWRGGRTDETGRFAIDHLPAGRIRLEIRRPDGTGATPLIVEVPEGRDAVEVTVTLGSLQEGAPL